MTKTLLALYGRFFHLLVCVLMGWSAFAGFLAATSWEASGRLGPLAAVFYAFAESMRSGHVVRWACYLATLANLSVVVISYKKSLPMRTQAALLFLISAGAGVFSGAFRSTTASPMLFAFVTLVSCTVLALAYLLLGWITTKTEENDTTLFTSEAVNPFTRTGLSGAWVMILLFLGGALLVASATRTALGNDEVFNLVNYSALGPAISLVRYDFPNNHLLYSIANSVLLWPGAPLKLTRLLPLACALLTAFLLYGIGRKVFGKRASALVLFFALFFPLTFELASHGRGYFPAIAFVCLGILYLLESANSEETHPGRSYATGVFFVSVSVMTVPSFGLLAICIAMSSLAFLQVEKRKQVNTWLIGGAATLLFLSPALLFLAIFWDNTYFAANVAANAQTTMDNLRTFAIHLVRPFAPGADGTTLVTSSVLAVAFITVAFFTGVRSSKNTRRWFVSVLTLSLLCILTICFVLTGDPARRQIVQFAPVLLLAFAAGLFTLCKPFIGRWKPFAITMFIALCILGVGYRLQILTQPPADNPAQTSMKELSKILDTVLADGDLLVTHSPYTMAVFAELSAPQRHHVFDSALAKFSKAPIGKTIWLLEETGRGPEHLAQQLAGPVKETHRPPVAITTRGDLTLYRMIHTP